MVVYKTLGLTSEEEELLNLILKDVDATEELFYIIERVRNTMKNSSMFKGCIIHTIQGNIYPLALLVQRAI